MRRIIKHIIAVFIVLLCTHAECQSQERIIFFKTDISTDTSGIINVREHIKINAEGYNFKRGIFRNIPITRKDKKGNRIPIDIDNISVLQDGSTANFKTSYKSSEVEIRVGSADVFLDEGEHEYIISYTANKQIGFFDTYDELYWNVTGNEWAFTIDTATCTFTSPGNATILEASCYTGLAGSTAKNCRFEKTDRTTLFFEATDLQIYEGLTIAAGFSKGVVTPPPPPGFLEENYGIVFSSLFLFLVLGYMIYSWFKFGRDPKKPVVVPQFSPPENLSPAHIAMYYNGHYNKSFFSYSIVNMAVKGFIKIEDLTKNYLIFFKDKHYKLTPLDKPRTKKLEAEEETIYSKLFKGSKKTVNVDGTYNSAFSSAFTAYEKHFAQDGEVLNAGKNRKFLWIPFLLLIGFWVSVSLYNGTETFFNIFLILGLLAAPLFMSIFLFIFSAFFIKRPNFGMMYKGFLIILSAVAIGVLFMDQTKFSFNTKVIALFSILLVLLFFAYRYLIRKPAAEKITLQAEIEGFKMYLGAAEEKQLQFFNSPKLTPEHFETLLPYALALGVEDIWGKKFKNLLAASGLEESYGNTWYTGTRPFEMSNLQSMGNNLGNTMQQSSVIPSSSSSSSGSGWSSGSSGGGSSGGGGGGGGGGGW